MSNPSSEIINELERTRSRLEILQELDLLESEFRLIQNEYNQRKLHILKLTSTYYIVEFKTHMNFQDSKMIPGNDVVCV